MDLSLCVTGCRFQVHNPLKGHTANSFLSAPSILSYLISSLHLQHLSAVTSLALSRLNRSSRWTFCSPCVVLLSCDVHVPVDYTDQAALHHSRHKSSPSFCGLLCSPILTGTTTNIFSCHIGKHVLRIYPLDDFKSVSWFPSGSGPLLSCSYLWCVKLTSVCLIIKSLQAPALSLCLSDGFMIPTLFHPVIQSLKSHLILFTVIYGVFFKGVNCMAVNLDHICQHRRKIIITSATSMSMIYHTYNFHTSFSSVFTTFTDLFCREETDVSLPACVGLWHIIKCPTHAISFIPSD